jgi:hypothetical protein
MYTEELDAVMQNPLISDSMKDKIWNDSFARQEAARLEASNAKSILTKIKENPFETGFFVGSTFTALWTNYIERMPKLERAVVQLMPLEGSFQQECKRMIVCI